LARRFFFDLSYIQGVIRKFRYLQRKNIWLRNFVPNSGLGQFRHGTSIVATGRQLRSTKVDAQSRNVRRILVRGVNAPLPPEAKKIWKTGLRNGAF